jgi:hypothetical protein
MFAPIAKFASIRTMLAIVVMFNLEVHQMDIRSTFFEWRVE